MIDNLVSCLARFSKRSMSQGVGKRKAFILRWAQDKGVYERVIRQYSASMYVYIYSTPFAILVQRRKKLPGFKNLSLL